MRAVLFCTSPGVTEMILNAATETVVFIGVSRAREVHGAHQPATQRREHGRCAQQLLLDAVSVLSSLLESFAPSGRG